MAYNFPGSGLLELKIGVKPYLEEGKLEGEDLCDSLAMGGGRETGHSKWSAAGLGMDWEWTGVLDLEELWKR